MYRIFFCLFCLFSQIHANTPDEAIFLSTEKLTEIFHTSEESNLRATMEKAIQSAKKSIIIFTFTFSDVDLIELINQKALEGIDVLVVIDRDHTNILAKQKCSEVKMLTRTSGEGRFHHKVLIIDDYDIWLGSLNFSKAAFQSQENLITHLQSEKFAKELLREVDFLTGAQKRTSPNALVEMIKDQRIELLLLPHANPFYNSLEKEWNSFAKKRLISLIKNAKKTIHIAVTTWTDPDLETAIMDAHSDGVHIEVLLSDLQTSTAWNLHKAGVSVKQYAQKNLMHNKWVLIDDSILVNGSGNWSKSTFSRNDESYVIISNLRNEQLSYIKNYWNYLYN